MLDVVILSNAKTQELAFTTMNAINSLPNTYVDYNVFLIEQNPKFEISSPSVQTIHISSPFNYNQFANFGAKLGTSEYICIANNDLIFTPGWFDEILKADYPICSPRCPDDKRQQDITENEIGEQVGRHLSGWCFVIKRSVWDKIGGFDEDFGFWCADNSLMEQLLDIGIKPMVVKDSIVLHLGSKTLKTMDNRDELTRMQVLKYNRKYNKNLFGWGT